MINEFEVKNYKSIKSCSIELGKFNIFIGENGCGKSNILEAFAMFSSSVNSNRVNAEELYSKGIRITTPKLTTNSFKNNSPKNNIIFKAIKEKKEYNSNLECDKNDNIYSEWFPVNYSEWFSDFDQNNLNKILIAIDKHKNKLDTKDSTSLKNIEILSKALLEKSDMLEKSGLFETKDFVIYNIETKALRGIIKESMKTPLGINGEGLDILISIFDKKEFSQLLEHSKFISWLDNVLIDRKDILKFEGHKLGKSTSTLYFKDKFMNTKNNIFSAENANEGILHILFYLALFISKKTPEFFAIDNIEKSLNPKLCRSLIKELAKLSKENNKQALITTHNPAILDGLNLNDDEQRLFVVSRTDEGYTKVERVKVKPNLDNEKYKLSEMWMRGYLGGIPNNF